MWQKIVQLHYMPLLLHVSNKEGDWQGSYTSVIDIFSPSTLICPWPVMSSHLNGSKGPLHVSMCPLQALEKGEMFTCGTGRSTSSTLPWMMVIRSWYLLSSTICRACSAIAERSMPYTCFAPACMRTVTALHVHAAQRTPGTAS